MALAIALEEELEAVIRFKPESRRGFPSDDGSGDTYLYVAKVPCPSCGYSIEVGSELGKTETGFCWRGCAVRITVTVDPAHIPMRLDDSRPSDRSFVCVCGEIDCRLWEAV